MKERISLDGLLQTRSRYSPESKKRLAALKRRVSKARRFPTNTCPASRHLHIMADQLTSKRGIYYMLIEEPDHCAESIYAVLASLWEARTKLTALDGDGETGR